MSDVDSKGERKASSTQDDLPTLPAIADLGRRVAWARKRLGMSQEELGKRAGMTRVAVAQVETGGSQRPRRIKELAAALDVPPAWLQFGAAWIDNLSQDALRLARAFDELSPEERAVYLEAVLNAAKGRDAP